MRAGDTVMLRTPTEILSTLDEYGRLEGLPFMPEMLAFFGEPFTVTARVDRACDTVHYSGVRRLADTVMLDDVRCDGAAHAGCGAQCRLYWKEAWLRPAAPVEVAADASTDEALSALERLATANINAEQSTVSEPIFRCQATELLNASKPVGRSNVRSYLHEFTGGNVGVRRFVRVVAHILFEKVGHRLGFIPSTNLPFPPSAMTGQAVTAPERGLRPGELVQIRSSAEICKTLKENGRNRGLWFDREMIPYCGEVARVKAKVERFIDEGTGRLVELASDCYILDGVVCSSDRSEHRWFCPRAIYPWWREAWLEPIDPGIDRTLSAPDDAATGVATH